MKDIYQTASVSSSGKGDREGETHIIKSSYFHLLSKKYYCFYYVK